MRTEFTRTALAAGAAPRSSASHAATARAADSKPSLRLRGWASKPWKQYTIGVFYPTPLNTYVQAMIYGAKQAAKKLGVKAPSRS
jgi:ABC-type sugar transport system substrate-binding protein